MFRSASSALAAAAIIALINLAAYSPTALSNKPDKCEPWPSCRKDADDGNGDDGGGGGGGGVVPAVEIELVDAIANAVTLRWATPFPGPDENEVDHYEVWFTTEELDASNFDPETISSVATLAERSLEAPAYDPGTAEYFTIRNLEVDHTYYIAVRAVDANGNVSEMTDSGSFAVAATRRTAPGDWIVETVAEVGDDNSCCSTTSAQFDAGGNPTVAWMRQSQMKEPGSIWFAFRESEPDNESWTTETVFVGEDCQTCRMREIHGFSHRPWGGPEDYVPAEPAILFSHRVQLRGRHTAESVEFAHRRGADDWVVEEVVRGGAREPGGIDGFHANFSMDFFFDPSEDDSAAGSWVPTAAYVTTPEWESPLTIYELVLAERHGDLSQAGTWKKTPVLECTIFDATSPRLESVRLRRGRDGSLHAMVRMHNDHHQWAMLIHRDLDGDLTYRRSGWLNAFAFDVDSFGRYYIAGALGEGSSILTPADLILVEDAGLVKISEPLSTNDLCVAPDGPVVEYDVADIAGEPDTYANGGSEGELIGELLYSSTFDLHLTGDIAEPAVHIFQNRFFNREVSELRVLSRCSGPNFFGWIRDAVDRVHSRWDLGTTAVSESGMAWAYNYGHSKWVVDDMMFVAHRETNACAP